MKSRNTRLESQDIAGANISRRQARWTILFLRLGCYINPKQTPQTATHHERQQNRSFSDTATCKLQSSQRDPVRCGDPSWIFLDYQQERSREFRQEVEARKAADALSRGSPFWTIGNGSSQSLKNESWNKNELIELTREEWEARRHRKMSRACSA